MHIFTQLLLFAAVCILVRTLDLAISAGISRDTIRAVCYGLAGLLLLIAILVNVFGLH